MSRMDQVTLVCGGGGVWGIAWMTGIAMGLADRGIDLREAAAFIGTSAGSNVATQWAKGLSLEDLFARQTDLARQPPEPAPDAAAMARLMRAMQRPFANREERREAMRRLALESPTIAASERRANLVVRLGLPDEAWPTKPLSIAAVDLETLELTVFDRNSGVPIIDAVAASGAVPGVWPPALIGGRRYIDGGIGHTADNASLAEGAKRVLILSPTTGSPVADRADSSAEIMRLRESGAKVLIVSPDEPSLAAWMLGPLDPQSRKPAAQAGRNQGATHNMALEFLQAR
jgi:NTE family protein